MNNLVPPEALKQLKPYITLASQLDQKNEPSVAYYCNLTFIKFKFGNFLAFLSNKVVYMRCKLVWELTKRCQSAKIFYFN